MFLWVVVFHCPSHSAPLSVGGPLVPAGCARLAPFIPLERNTSTRQSRVMWPLKIHLLHPLNFIGILVNTKHCPCTRQYIDVKPDVVLPHISQHLFRKQTLFNFDSERKCGSLCKKWSWKRPSLHAGYFSLHVPRKRRGKSCKSHQGAVYSQGN